MKKKKDIEPKEKTRVLFLRGIKESNEELFRTQAELLGYSLSEFGNLLIEVYAESIGRKK